MSTVPRTPFSDPDTIFTDQCGPREPVRARPHALALPGGEIVENVVLQQTYRKARSIGGTQCKASQREIGCS